MANSCPVALVILVLGLGVGVNSHCEEVGRSHLRCTRAAGLMVDRRASVTPASTAISSESATQPTPKLRETKSLVDVLLGRIAVATAAPDSVWAATVEKQRCSLRPGSPLPVAGLVTRLASRELRNCDPALLWDASMPAAEETLVGVIAALSRPFVLARIPKNTAPAWLEQPVDPPYAREHRGHWKDVIPARDQCRHIVALVDDVMAIGDILGNVSEPRVVVICRSPMWRIRDYLASPFARSIRNLLVIHDRTWRHGTRAYGFPDINLYTHHLFYDSLGSSIGRVVTAWRCDRLTRPSKELFPLKMKTGFAGHQFTVSATDTPPFMYKTTLNVDGDLSWDGLEARIFTLLSEYLNFTINIQEAPASETDVTGGAAVRVVNTVASGAAELGAGGIYVTSKRIRALDMGFSHTQDCASVISMASVAIPRYRAIMGPFQWTVWLALTLAYLFAILPLVFSHTFSLKILIKHPAQIENMFWYVFGTFTNAFSFKGRDSWGNTSQTSTRMLIGWYWVFSIIVTACYTGCIISFIAFPAYPEVLDYIYQLYDGGYRIGTLHTDGWSTWFLNSSDPMTDALLKDLETVPSVWHGLVNMTRASWWHPYAFLGSRLYMEHVVRTNYTAEGKRSLVHVAKQCFAPFWVSLAFPQQATYTERFIQVLMRATQTGLVEKLRRDVAWDVSRKSFKKGGRALLQVSSGSALRLPPPEDRLLTLDDVQGMFLLLGAGFAIAMLALTCENIIGRIAACRKHCMPGPRRRSSCRSEDMAIIRGSSKPPSVPGIAWSQDGEADGAFSRRMSSAAGNGQSCTAVAECHDEPESPHKLWAVQSFRHRARSLVSALSWAGMAPYDGALDNKCSDFKQRLSVTEDQILHLSNAWSDQQSARSDLQSARSDVSSCGDDAHLRLALPSSTRRWSNVDSVFGSRTDIPEASAPEDEAGDEEVLAGAEVQQEVSAEVPSEKSITRPVSPSSTH